MFKAMYKRPLQICPKCDGDAIMDCSCCGGEGLVTAEESEAWLAAEEAEVEYFQAADALEQMMDEMLDLREASEAARERMKGEWDRYGAGRVAIPAGE